MHIKYSNIEIGHVTGAIQEGKNLVRNVHLRPVTSYYILA